MTQTLGYRKAAYARTIHKDGGLAPAVWAQMMYGRFEQSLPTELREIERASERMEKEYIFLPHFPRAELLHYPNSRQSM